MEKEAYFMERFLQFIDGLAAKFTREERIVGKKLFICQQHVDRAATNGITEEALDLAVATVLSIKILCEKYKVEPERVALYANTIRDFIAAEALEVCVKSGESLDAAKKLLDDVLTKSRNITGGSNGNAD